MTHQLLDKITQKIIYRSAVRPITKSNPNHRLDIDGGESGASMGYSEGSKPTKHLKYQLSSSDLDRMMLVHP